MIITIVSGIPFKLIKIHIYRPYGNRVTDPNLGVDDKNTDMMLGLY